MVASNDQTTEISVSTVDLTPAKSTRKVLFSAMKNEAPFLLEWVAYHKLIGFDEIVVCSNPSNDGMEEILAALDQAGEIRHLQTVVGKGESPQIIASKHFTREVGYRDGDWYMWLDADEFLNVHVGDRTVDALIEAIGARFCALINWRVFGSNGHSRFPGRFIDTAFTGAASVDFPAHYEQKTFFRFSSAVRSFGLQGINRPLMARQSGLTTKDIVVGAGIEGDPESIKHRRWLRGFDTRATARVALHEVGWSLAQINHYIVRTPEFFALKKLRGRGYKPDAVGAQNRRHTADFLLKYDRNDEEDRSILVWQDQVSEGINRLMRVEPIASAVRRSEELVTAILADDTLSPESQEDTALPASPIEPTFALTFPHAESAYVEEMYAKAESILEYGSGGSTELAARLGKSVISVESDKAWANRLTGVLAGISDRAKVHHVNIGPTRKWGRPIDGSGFRSYPSYALSVWDRADMVSPDLVLIDGRFRASCLVAVLLRAQRPTTVLFDDYLKRGYYHGVEKLARKEEMVGRMARFTVVPGSILPEVLTEAIGWFTDSR